MSKVTVIDHPLILHKLTMMRDKNTDIKAFRDLVNEISLLMAYEVTRDLPLEKVRIKTPLVETDGWHLAGRQIGVVPILRAGLGMVDGMLSILPAAKVGHVGLYRDPESLEPVEYYCKLPTDAPDRMLLLLDPMLATGGSAIAAIDFLKQRGCYNISLVNILGCPEGVAAVQEAHPDVDIYLCAIDEGLNDHGYIVPGLGDAGDRIFGTK